MTHPTCEQRVSAHLESEIETLRTLWDLWSDDPEAYDDELGNLDEYGLCFDYVEPDTFPDQREGYWRYQLSYGGPSDEFRFYVTPGRHGLEPHRIEYWLLDWYDGAHRTLNLKSADGQLLLNIWGFFEPTWAEYGKPEPRKTLGSQFIDRLCGDDYKEVIEDTRLQVDGIKEAFDEEAFDKIDPASEEDKRWADEGICLFLGDDFPK